MLQNALQHLGRVGSADGYTLLNATDLGTIAAYDLLPNTPYSLVFSQSTVNAIIVRSMGAAYTASNNFVFNNNTSTSTGTSLSPIATSSLWQGSTGTNATFGLTIGAIAVPGPIPLLGAVAAFGFSRRLRRRTQQQP